VKYLKKPAIPHIYYSLIHLNIIKPPYTHHFPARLTSGSADSSANNMIGSGKLNGAANRFIG
jgi:hypothetical protein